MYWRNDSPQLFRKTIPVVLLCLLAISTVSAAPTVTVGNFTAPTGAQCQTGSVPVSVDVTATASPDTSGPYVGPCEPASSSDPGAEGGTNSKRVEGTISTSAVITNVTASATDGTNSASLTGPATGGTFSGNLSTAGLSDGSILVTVTGEATETVTTTITGVTQYYSSPSCGGSQKGSTPFSSSEDTSASGSNSADTSYLLDNQAPTVTHTLDSASVMQNTPLDFNITVTGGSSGKDFSIRGGVVSFTPEWGSPGNFTFGIDPSGVAPQTTEAAAYMISCDTPAGGPYTSEAQLVTTNDLCGGSYGPVDSTSTPTFTVTSALSCLGVTNTAVVTAPLGGDPEPSGVSGYALVECFNSQLAGHGKSKVVSDPGTVHAGTVFHTGDGPKDCTETVDNVVLTFTIDSDFDFLTTGKSPNAHVFIGDATGPVAPGFFYHSGSPLTEYKLPAGAITGAATDMLTVDLSGLDIGCGAGKIPKGLTIYARAHTKFVGTPTADESHTFGTGVTSSLGALSDSESIVENPTSPVCVNGVLATP